MHSEFLPPASWVGATVPLLAAATPSIPGKKDCALGREGTATPGWPCSSQAQRLVLSASSVPQPQCPGESWGGSVGCRRGKSLLAGEDSGSFTAAVCNSERIFSWLAAADAAAFTQGGTGF